MPESLLGQWLSFYGPLSLPRIAKMIGIVPSRLLPLIDSLAEAQSDISGTLLTGEDRSTICDRDNFEILLRLARSEAAPSFIAMEIRMLPQFVARHQGIAIADNDLSPCLNQLLCWYAPAGLWETEILPARIRNYQPQTMDAYLQGDNLHWIGGSGQKIAFCFEDELDLMASRQPADGDQDQEIQGQNARESAADLFPHDHGRFPFDVLQQVNKLDSATLHHRLWQGVWQGNVTNDSYAALRRGIANGFKPANAANKPATYPASRPGRGPRRRPRGRRYTSIPNHLGNWLQITYPEPTGNLLDGEELIKERVRLLLERYGILFREMLSLELPVFRWAALFRALRLMELSGEVLAGYFFTDIPGLQFVSVQSFRELQRPLDKDHIFWLNAADPASLCGLGIEALKTILPKRLPGIHMVFHGSDLVLISHQQAKRLEIRVAADHPCLETYFGFLDHFFNRSVTPLRSITIETVNDRPAPENSGYISVLQRLFDTSVDFKSIVLFPRH
jgi:ATP-dependent Lhr-like helicase